MSKKFDERRLRDIIIEHRGTLRLSQAEVAQKAHMNRIMYGRIERGTYIPSIIQLIAISNALQFDPTDVFIEEENASFDPVDQ